MQGGQWGFQYYFGKLSTTLGEAGNGAEKGKIIILRRLEIKEDQLA